MISTGGGIVENEACRDILNSLKTHVIFIDRDYNEVLEANSSKIIIGLMFIDKGTDSKPVYQDVTVEEVYKRRLPLFKECSMHHFYIPPFELMSSVFEDVEVYKNRMKRVFVDYINDKWLSASSLRHPLPPSDSFFACTDMDFK